MLCLNKIIDGFNMKSFLMILLIVLTFCNTSYSQQNNPSAKLLIRCDDIGMSHSVNMAAKELIETGLIFSASVMFTCAWYEEAVDILKAHPEIATGIHLTLNAEWKNYRWGPVAGMGKVPSLVDKHGYFFPSRATFFANNPKIEEVEIELRAQIERAINSGLKISYLDYHMGTAVDKPELRKIVEKLAHEYNLGISRYFGETDLKNMYSDPIESKKDSLLMRLKNLPTDKITLLVCHIGKDNEELQAMVDLNPFGPSQMSRNRESELQALIAVKRSNFFELNNILLIDYKDAIKEFGLENMKSPVATGY